MNSHTIRGVVKNGRIVIDEPTDLPEGTLVDLGIFSPGAIGSDALALLGASLQPVIHTIYRLWEAVDAGDTPAIEACRAQVLGALNRARNTDTCKREKATEAEKRLERLMPSEIRAQDLSRLELAVFDARLPHPPDGEYAQP